MRKIRKPGSGRGLTRLLAAAALFVATGAAVVALSPTAAQADCHGVGVRHTIFMYLNVDGSGPLIGKEVANSGTCDGLGDYYGRVYDTYTDNSCVYARYWDNNYFGTQGRSCDSAGAAYSFHDTNGDSHAYIDLCTNYKCRYGDDSHMTTGY